MMYKKLHFLLFFFSFHTDIDECSSNPCLNGGTCVDQVNRYVCNCDVKFRGVHCEKLGQLLLHCM